MSNKKLTKAALVKIIKEEMADIQERITPEMIAMKSRSVRKEKNR